ncbi:MAG: ATP-binding cassette domain-containing protein [Oscillospiraceae bacterium]
MKKRLITLGCVLFWLALWQVGAMLFDQKILLVTPLETAARLIQLVPSAEFWRSVGFSAARVLLGFALGLASGTLLALLAGKVRFVKTLFSPLISAVKAVPVASMTLLALVWVSSRNLSVLVSFLIALPIVYSNMLEGIESLDPKLSEMAELFRIPAGKRFTGIYLSQLLPYFRSASRLAMGLSWKSGAAAEIIGIPSGSIGEKLYESKIYLETADMFAWTITVVLLSWVSEKLFLLLVNGAAKLVSGGGMLRRETLLPGREYAPAGISVQGLAKSYGRNTVLDGFCCEFPAGEITAVMGASGCGKTTLISLLTGLLEPDGGCVEVTPANAAFSAVFQEDRLCENLTVAANIRLVCGHHRSSSEIERTLDALGLSGWGDKPVRELSGGMKRRAALARALLADYGVILLDEPFKGLDEATKSQVVSYCREVLAGKTVILVTHDSEECQALAKNVIKI